MSKHVCVLAGWESEDLALNGRLPDCREHRHIRFAEAIEMVEGSGLYRRPVAEWIGRDKRRIAMLRGFRYTPVRTQTGHVLFNRIEL